MPELLLPLTLQVDMRLPGPRKLFTYFTALLFPGIALLAVMSVLFNIMDYEGKCSTQHLTYMCGLYADRKVQGPLCDVMCSQHLNIHSCLSLRPEKHVLHVSWEQREPWDMSHDQAEVILKFDSGWHKMAAQSTTLTDTHLNCSHHTEQQAYNTCMEEFESSQDCHKFGRRMALYADGDSDGEVTLGEATNMLSLLSIREFFMLAALNDSEWTLDILGYCGGFYAVQKAQHTSSQIFHNDDHILDILPVTFIDNINEVLVPMFGVYGDRLKNYVYRNFQQVRVPTWQDRVNFINQSFAIVYDFSFQYGTTVRACDSHFGNYGVMDSGKVKYIDMDSIMSTKAAQTDLNNRDCEEDEDCKALGDNDDCFSTCDREIGLCHTTMKTNDLHNFCTGTLSPILLSKAVLLELGVGKEVAVQLLDLVQQCKKLPLYPSVEDFRTKGIMYIWNKFNSIVQDKK